MTATNDEACAILRDICDSGKLEHTKEVCESDAVVMNQHGALAYANGNEELARKRRERKELVLGLNGHDSHSLAEANAIIDGPASAAD